CPFRTLVLDRAAAHRAVAGVALGVDDRNARRARRVKHGAHAWQGLPGRSAATRRVFLDRLQHLLRLGAGERADYVDDQQAGAPTPGLRPAEICGFENLAIVFGNHALPAFGHDRMSFPDDLRLWAAAVSECRGCACSRACATR